MHNDIFKNFAVVMNAIIRLTVYLNICDFLCFY